MRPFHKSSLLAGLTTIVILAAGGVSAETLKFKADMTGSGEVPPNESAGKGTGEITLDTTTKKVTWTVTADGLSGDATAAHFHGPAAAGENADPVVDISTSMKFGSAELTDQQLADLQGGKWYLNIHTAKFPDGEIRGQVEKAQ
jgi:hypothetical protein